MTAYLTLWLPVIVSAVAVFLASSIVNAVLPWHKNDFKRLSNEDAARSALRPLAIPPGEYMVPRCIERAELKSPEFIAKMNEGPVMTMTVFPNGPISMGKSLGLWFVYCLFISSVAACIAWAARFKGAESHSIFHFTAAVSFCCYVVGVWQSSIWYGRPWSTTLKSTIDGIIYAVITGLIFVWLWPIGH
jgi:hypothetical protein